MLKERIDDLVDILAEEYSRLENTFLIRNNQQLIKYLENPERWKAEQMAHRQAFKRELAVEAKQRLKILNQKANKVLLLTYQEVDKDIISIQEKEIVINGFQKEIKAKMAELEKFNSQRITELVNIAFKTYERTVRIISATTKTDHLFEAIKRQMPKGIQNGLKVTYANGRAVQWKSYMEMNTRTTLQTEATERAIEAGAKANQVFVICDSFADCAKDHADYQGKIYYNEQANITPEIKKYIDSHGILSMQEVTKNDPWLTTRPNCRHNFHAISTDDVMGGMSANKILEQEGFKFGNYKGSNYEDLQKQRYNERQIRKWKTRLENQKQINKETGVPDNRAVQQAQAKVSEWQKKQRELIASNPDVLKRQYERENAKVIVEDLGVKYRYKVVDGELVKKK